MVADAMPKPHSNLVALVTIHARNSKLRNSQQQETELTLTVKTIMNSEVSHTRRCKHVVTDIIIKQ